MLKLLKKTPYWYLIAIPLLCTFIGAGSNQAVLIANGGKFPVLVNQEQIAQMCTPDTDDKDDSLAKIVQHLKHEDSKISAPDANTCANGGEFLDAVHTIMQPTDHFKFLADVFNLRVAIFSIGDFLLMLGDWIWAWSSIAWVVLVLRKFIEA
jgi:hypothetical protein